MIKRIFNILFTTTLTIIAIILVAVVVIFVIAWRGSEMTPPEVVSTPLETQEVKSQNDSITYLGKNWVIKRSNGLHEMYTEGDPYERGVANGKLSQEYIIAQEEAFVDQIKKMIPSESYLKFLKYITGFMNRNLEDYVPQENKEEIYGIAKASSPKFEWIGEPYFRQMNYHAAHDIGHALQNLMLVGCTSLSSWSSNSEDGSLIVGRNFDFWVGDAFAKDKIISFVKPAQGIPFAFVTWGAFTGVSSGMNTAGLTVTINAAKSSIPTDAATPVSLVARQILQYAHNIQDATAIAEKFTMFVSESFMISSAVDNYSIVIEKTPSSMQIYRVENAQSLSCANHYQSKTMQDDQLNIVQMKESASIYRQARVTELMDSLIPLNPEKMAIILRDKKGHKGADIGLGNEKAINQLIAHHSVIFQPKQLKFWVSTQHWQEGEYVCYDLNKIFGLDAIPTESVASRESNIAADTNFINSLAFQQFLDFRTIKNDWTYHKKYVDPQSWIGYNSNYYDAYRIAGDMYMSQKDTTAALSMYEKSLSKEIATVPERKSIEKKIDILNK